MLQQVCSLHIARTLELSVMLVLLSLPDAWLFINKVLDCDMYVLVM